MKVYQEVNGIFEGLKGLLAYFQVMPNTQRHS